MAYTGKTKASNNQTVSDNQTVFTNTWSLKDFAKMFVGKARRETANYKNGELKVNGLRFEKQDGAFTFVAFAKSLGDISNDELKEGKNGGNNLRVGENQEGFFYLFRGSSVQYELGEEIDW